MSSMSDLHIDITEQVNSIIAGHLTGIDVLAMPIYQSDDEAAMQYEMSSIGELQKVKGMFDRLTENNAGSGVEHELFIIYDGGQIRFGIGTLLGSAQ